jgi:hypothetical protein
LVLTRQVKFDTAAVGQDQTIVPGCVIFVERAVEHRFLDITEDLTLLVFFAPPEGAAQ